MEIINYIDTGYEWFSKGLEIVRSIIIKIASFLPGEPRVVLALITLVVSVYLGYLMISKFTTHPFSTSNIVYLIIISWLIFTTLFYFTL